jgi:hypothetical protein
MKKLDKGEAAEPRNYYDNYNLFLNSELSSFKREKIKPYIRDVLDKQS